jgi:hypothetical protein
MSVASAALALREPVLPLVATIDAANLCTVKVEHRWLEGAAPNAQERCAKLCLPVADDPSKKELFLCVIDQFLDACSNERLHLLNGPSRHSKFRLALEGAAKIEWQAISANRANKTNNSFDEDVRVLLLKCFAPSSRSDQLECLRSVQKPHTVTVDELSSRLTVINRLGRLMPGSWDAVNVRNNLCTDATELKRAFFAMVPMNWRIKFAETAHDLGDANCTFAVLTCCFSLLEAVEK